MNSLKVLIFASFLISGFVRAEGTHNGPHSGNESHLTPSSSFNYEKLGLFQNEKIDQDNASPDAWNYLAPNEHYNYYFEACLPKEGGAYISVGTMRGMNVASSGKVSHLILMDFDPSAVQFNKVNVQLIQKAKDRAEYLSLLFTGKPQAKLEEEYRAGNITGETFLSKLSLITPRDLTKVWQKETGIQLSDAEIDKWEKFIQTGVHMRKDSMGEYIRDEMKRDLASYFSEKVGDKTFFGSDERFKKMQSMINEGKVTVTTGNITGDKTLNNLGNLLKSKNMELAGVDFSNISDYLDKDQQEKVWKNIKALPIREKGRVFYTTYKKGWKSPGNRTSDEIWHYLALRHQNGKKDFPSGNTQDIQFSKIDGSGDVGLRLDPSMQNEKHQALFTPIDAPCK